MAGSYGIDTSVLMRLITRDPPDTYRHCLEQLNALIEDGRLEIFASNQVIGEAYVAVQHHYDVSEPEARTALLEVLQSGLVSPLNGPDIIAILKAPGSPGLFDRLIADGYRHEGLEVLTLDRRMSTLANVYRL